MIDLIAYKSMTISQSILFDEMNFSAKRRWGYFKATDSRQIGKTHTLVQLANEYNCPIIIPAKHWQDHIQAISWRLYKRKIELITICDMRDVCRKLKGTRFDLLLCEEQIDYALFPYLRERCNCLVGFTRESKGNELRSECHHVNHGSNFPVELLGRMPPMEFISFNVEQAYLKAEREGMQDAEIPER